MGVYLPTAHVRQELLRGRRRLCGPPTPQAPSPELEAAQARLFGAERPWLLPISRMCALVPAGAVSRAPTPRVPVPELGVPRPPPPPIPIRGAA